MAPKRATRSTPVTENPTTTTVTNAQLQAMIDQGVTAALTARDANRNGDDSHTSGTGARRTERVTRECTYQDFMKCQPLYFKGTEGVVELTQWFEIDGDCIPHKQLLCGKSDQVLHIYLFGRSSDVCFVAFQNQKPGKKATKRQKSLMDKKISTFAERQAENKRKLDNNHQTQQQLPKRQNVVQAYAAGTGERKEYAGTLPLCNKCKFHHNGPCTVKCANCKRVGHLTRDCWSSAATNNQRTLTCYECGNQGHYKSDCPKLKNRNHGNQAEGTGTHGMVLALGGGETDQDPNNIEDEIEA
ncbi:reverse transcriptase domain-containing protein [Tanacetum coccineum]